MIVFSIIIALLRLLSCFEMFQVSNGGSGCFLCLMFFMCIVVFCFLFSLFFTGIDKQTVQVLDDQISLKFYPQVKCTQLDTIEYIHINIDKCYQFTSLLLLRVNVGTKEINICFHHTKIKKLVFLHIPPLNKFHGALIIMTFCTLICQ